MYKVSYNVPIDGNKTQYDDKYFNKIENAAEFIKRLFTANSNIKYVAIAPYVLKTED